MESCRGAWPRREVLKAISAAGIGSAAFVRALASVSEGSPEVTGEMIRHAEWIAGLEFTDAERELMLEDLSESRVQLAELRSFPICNEVPPALYFDPAPGRPEIASIDKRKDLTPNAVPGDTAAIRTDSAEDLASTWSASSASIRCCTA